MQQDFMNFPDLDVFIRNRPDELERREFLSVAPVYPFTTENIGGYFPLIDIPGKRVLTISGSGDHVLNAIYHGAESIDAFDINQMSRIYTELKMTALQYLSYEEFLRYFVLDPDNPDILSAKLSLRFAEHLSDDTREVFFRLYETWYDGGQLRTSQIFYNRPPVDHKAQYYNAYMKNEENYLVTRSNISDARYRWFRSNVTELSGNLRQTDVYDIILLSNIADYAGHMYPGPDHLKDFFSNIVLPLRDHLSEDGIICAACIFKLDGSPDRVDNDLYNPEKRKQVLVDLGLSYRELRFPGAIEDYEDGLLVVQ